MKASVTTGKQPSPRAPGRTAAAVAPPTSDPTGALALQRNLGNRATRGLFDSTGGRDDAAADQHAGGAASSQAAAPQPRFDFATLPILHVRARGAASHAPAWAPAPAPVRLRTTSSAPQTKLVVGEPDDAFEHEADRVAEAVTRMTAPGDPGEPGSTIRPAVQPRIQRKCATCAADSDEPCKCVQRKAESSAAATALVAPAALPRGGQPLSARDRSFFEPRFGVDFSRVRIHNDAPAAEMARSLQAQAFTVGDSIVFGAGRFDPTSHAGRKLLAHELTHVVQQSGSSGPSTIQRAPDLAAAAKPPEPAEDRGPDRPKGASYDYRGVDMSADPAFMRAQLRVLVREHGLAGADYWYANMLADHAIPAPRARRHSSNPGRFHPRTAADAVGDNAQNAQDQAVAAELAPTTLALARTIFAEVRAEAVKFLAEFEAGLKLTLLLLLQESATRIEAERIKYGLTKTGSRNNPTYRGQNTVTFQGTVGAANDLLALQRKRAALVNELGGDMMHTQEIGAKIARLDEDYKREATAAALRYPALGAVLNESGDLSPKDRLVALTTGELTSKRGLGGRRWLDHTGAGVLGAVFDSRLTSIQKVRDDVATDPDRLWRLDNIVALTEIRLATRNKTMANTLVREKATQVKEDHAWASFATDVVLFAIAVVAAAPTGGGSFAALSAYQLVKDVQEYRVELALSNTDLDRKAAAISAGEPSLFWVALDVVGFAADVPAAAKAFGALRSRVRTALRARGAAATLAEDELRLAADALPGLKRPGLGKRLLDSLADLRKTGAETAEALGKAGKAEVAAVAHATQGLAQEAKSAETLVILGEHEVKATRSGKLVVCSDCGWLRDRYAAELAGRADLTARLEVGEARTAAGTLDAAAKRDIAELATELEQGRKARIVSESGEATIEAVTEARKTNFRKQVKPGEVAGAPPVQGGSAGHARSKHGVSSEQQAKILNEPERIFSGVNPNGREVDIYYKDGSVVITEAGKKESVITSYGKVDAKKPSVVSPDKWANDPRYVEIKPRGGSLEVTYPNRDRWELGDWP